MACSSSVTNDEIKHRILNIYAKFVSDVEPDRLSDWLVQEGVISVNQWQKIRHENSTTQDRCRALLHHLLSIQHPRSFLVVRQALSNETHYLLEDINNQEQGCGICVQPDTETFSRGKTRLQQPETDYEDKKKAWEAEKDRLLEMQKELEKNLHIDRRKIEQLEKDNEDQKRAWEEEIDRLLRTQKDLETRLKLDVSEKLYRERKVWCKEKEQLMKQIQVSQQQSLDKSKIQQLENDNDDHRQAWKAEKDRLLQMQEEHEEQKRAWEEEKDRLLTTQREIETELNIEVGDWNLKKRIEQSLLAEQSNEIELLRKENRTLKQELEATKTVSDKLRYITVQVIKTKSAKEGKKFIYGLTILHKELFVVTEKSSSVEVYDSMKFSFSRRLNLKELIDPTDIGSCNRNNCLYINDYKGLVQSNEILRINSKGKLIKKWSTGDDRGEGMSVTDESSVILTVYEKNKLNEYSPDGQLVREINLSLDAGIYHPRHAIKLSNGYFVVSHGLCDDDLHRVCVVDANGKLKKSFGGKRGSSIGQMDSPVHLTVDGNGFVMIADHLNSRILLLDQDLEYRREILLNAEKHGLRNPFKILLDESHGRVFVADNAWDSEKKIYTDGRISMYDF